MPICLVLEEQLNKYCMNTYKNTLVSGISFFLGLIFLSAGIEKLTGLPDIIGPHYLVEKLAEHGLGLYGQFISYSQIIVGFLLIHNRFRLLGSIMLFPLLLNILMVTISLKWNGTPYVVAFLLLLNVVLLLVDFHKLKFLLTDAAIPELPAIQIKRSNIKLDIYYGCLLLLILIGGHFGWTDTGKLFARTGVFLILVSMLSLRVYSFVQRKRGIAKW